MSTSKDVTLAIDGMSCGHCVTAVQNALTTVPGVSDAAVSIGAARQRRNSSPGRSRRRNEGHRRVLIAACQRRRHGRAKIARSQPKGKHHE
jgi:copper chaperone CopZ